jgi:hypothetical protein
MINNQQEGDRGSCREIVEHFVISHARRKCRLRFVAESSSDVLCKWPKYLPSNSHSQSSTFSTQELRPEGPSRSLHPNPDRGPEVK